MVYDASTLEKLKENKSYTLKMILHAKTIANEQPTHIKEDGI